MNFVKIKLEEIIKNAINELEYPILENIEIIRDSDRPDLSDFQSNIAMNLAKQLKQNPRQIATNIVEKIKIDNVDFSIDGPGFININVSNKFIEEVFNKNVSREIIAPQNIENTKKIIIDYGGPNVAKSLHVGHLRASIIGEALKNLARFKGYDVVGDIHLGDWGLPMGLIITSIKEKGLKLPLSIDELNPIYPEASKRSKEDAEFMARAQEETKKLQNGDKENHEIWRSFWNTSVNDIKETLSLLNIDFDLWYGESDANDDVVKLTKDFHDKGFTSISEGAEIIDLQNFPLNGSEIPPFIMIKSNGAVMYGMTDVATLYDRVKRQNADMVWYVVDARQALHFHQVFSVADITGVKGEATLEHLGFGAVLGEDKKPLKTRNGDNVSLIDLISDTISYAKKKIEESEKTKSLSTEEKEKIANAVGISALKFADLINPRMTDYIFNLDKFVSFEGKTGPYILYTAVRIKSLLKNITEDFYNNDIIIYNKYDKDLSLKLLDFQNIIDRAFEARGIHILCQYIYDLAVSFNNFYHNNKILNNEDLTQRNSWLKLSKMTLEIFEKFADIIKIDIPERM